MDTTLLRLVLADRLVDLPREVAGDIYLAALSLLGGGEGHRLPNGFLIDYPTVELAAKRFATPEVSERARWNIIHRNRQRDLY